MEFLAAQKTLLRFAVIACSAVVVIASIGPWAKVFGESLYGLDRDGGFTIVLGALAGIATVLRLWRPGRRRWLDWLVVLCLGLSSAIAMYDWNDVQDLEEQTLGFVEVGWGLWLAAIASPIGTLLGLAVAIIRSPATPSPIDTFGSSAVSG